MKPRHTNLLFLLLTAAALPGFAQVVIDDVIPAAANTTMPDEDGDYPAVIIIRAVEFTILTGRYLTDDLGLPTKWQFPIGYVLTSGQTITVFASGKDRRPDGPEKELHTNFRYPCLVPFAGLYQANGQEQDDSFSDFTDHCQCLGELIVRGPSAGRNLPASTARTLIPGQDIGMDWIKLNYNATDWIRGPLGVGYDLGESPYCNGLILYHTMDTEHISSSTLLDQSGPTLHDGTLVSEFTSVPGQVAEALAYFKNPDEHVKVSHHAELDPGSDPFTAALWFRADTPLESTFTEVLVAKGADDGALPGWRIYRTQAGTFVEVVSVQGTRYTVNIGPTQEDTWHHIALVVDKGANLLRGYLNGSPQGTTPLSALAVDDFSSTATLFEGRDNPGVHPYTGDLDEFAIWDHALSAAEIAEIYATGLNGTSIKDPSAFPGSGTLYTPHIGTDVLDKMRGQNSTAYVRVLFKLDAFPSQLSKLALRMHYDDGFRCWLNGSLIAQRNAPSSAPAWNDAALANRPDDYALTPDYIDLTPYKGLLNQDVNILAVQGLNATADEDRFLVLPELCVEQEREPPGEDCTRTSAGSDFWVCFPENYEEEPGNPLTLKLCITGPRLTKGIVEIPGLGWTTTFTIDADRTVDVPLPKAVELEGEDDIEFKGVHIMANAPVTVYGLTHMDYTTDTFLGIPTASLGIEYLVMNYENVHDNVPLLHGTQFGIVAPYKDTLVTITPNENVGPYTAGVSYQIMLQRGETYQLRNETGTPANLTGTEIKASKPIGVFGSHRCANIASSTEFFCDTIVEQLLPLHQWGHNYAVAPLYTRDGDTVRILAQQDNTLVSVNFAPEAVIDRGEFYERTLPNSGPGAPGIVISSDSPLLVAQYSNSSDADDVTDADPFMALIQGDSAWLKQYIFCAPPTSGFAGNYINVVAASIANLSTITVDGSALLSLAGVQTGTFSNGYAYARAPLPATPTGAHRAFTQGQPFGLTIYGFNEFESYGHPGGLLLHGGAPPVISAPSLLSVNSTEHGSNSTAPAPATSSLAEFFDDCDEPTGLSLAQNPPAGTTLSVGTHTLTLSVTDSSGHTSTHQMTLSVQVSWETEYFGEDASDPALEETVWGPTANPDGDPYINCLEKKIGSDPNNSADPEDPLQMIVGEEPGNEYIKVRLRRSTTAGDGPFIEGTSDLIASPWLGGLDVFQELIDETVTLPGGEQEDAFFKALETEGLSVPQYFLRLRCE